MGDRCLAGPLPAKLSYPLVKLSPFSSLVVRPGRRDDVDAIRLYLQDQPLLPTRTARFAADDFLFHAGEPADEFFLLHDGLVALR